MGESGVLNESPTDLSPIMSTFMSANGTRYHLHPELVKQGEVEVISLCVDCLQLVKEEDDAGTIDPESPDAEAKTEKRNISKNSEKNPWLSLQDVTTVCFLESKNFRAPPFWSVLFCARIELTMLLSK